MRHNVPCEFPAGYGTGLVRAKCMTSADWCRIINHRGGAMEPARQARVERRLAAILAADVAGYSRLIEADEEGTLRRLKWLRAEVIDPKIAEHRGRIVQTTGDGVPGEFA